MAIMATRGRDDGDTDTRVDLRHGAAHARCAGPVVAGRGAGLWRAGAVRARLRPGPAGLGRARRARGRLPGKAPENVSAMFGAAAAGGVFVPVNPCSSRSRLRISWPTAMSPSSSPRASGWRSWARRWPPARTRTVLLTGERPDASLDAVRLLSGRCAGPGRQRAANAARGDRHGHGRHPLHLGQHGRPKGGAVHRNMLAGAFSVSGYATRRRTASCACCPSVLTTA
jgi:hypothetical protein